MIRITPFGTTAPAPARPRQTRDRFTLPCASPAATSSVGSVGLLGLQETPDHGLDEALQHAGSVLDALRQLQAGLLTGTGRGQDHPDPAPLLAALDACSPDAANPGLTGVLAAIRVRAHVVAAQLHQNRMQSSG